MSGAKTIQYITVPLSASVSEPFALLGAKSVAVWSPILTSCQAFLHGSFDTTSANFVRMFKSDGSSHFIWNVGPGSGGIILPEVTWPMLHGKIVLSAAQAAVRSLAVITKI